jgi:hypothetical protein
MVKQFPLTFSRVRRIESSTPMKSPRSSFVLLISACLLSLVQPGSAAAQFKIDLVTCEDLKITEAHYGINTVETATCVNPTKNFKPKGTLRNVNVLSTFPAVPTGAGITFLVTKNDANGEYVQNIDYAASPRHTTAYARFIINTPGKYFVRMANYYDKTQVWATTDFNVGEDTGGPRAVGNTAAGQGKVSICKEIDDNWKCVAEASEWKAQAPFNVLFKNPTPSGVDFIGIIFFKQDANGKDVEFINEYQQNIGEKNRWYATTGDSLSLPAGMYSVYIIAWGKRETMEHRGNPTEYFAKTTLTVK